MNLGLDFSTSPKRILQDMKPRNRKEVIKALLVDNVTVTCAVVTYDRNK
jgi:hypothetical protein